jgi:hypothetical protein
MMNDYQLEFVIRDKTEEEILKIAGDIHDFLFLSNPSIEHEMAVMRVDEPNGLTNIFVTESASGPFGDRIAPTDEDDDDDDDDDE